jgi:uncharacterized spore protein YtfJ
MKPEDALDRITDNLSVRRVFGAPVERDGTTVIPVAIVIGGAGAGGDEVGGSGGGYGIWARGLGVYSIREGQVRFVPAVDVTLLALAATVVGARLARQVITARRGGRRGPARRGCA